MESDDQTESADQNHVSRRRFLHSLGIAGVVGASGSLLAACGGGDGSSNGSGASSASASSNCTDLSGLSDQEKKRRKQMVKSLQYVEDSPNEKKYCSNCQLYVESDYGEGCGGCTLFPGPVNADGYCNSWAAQS